MWLYIIKGGPVLIAIGVVSIAAGSLVFLQWMRLRHIEQEHSKPLQELARLLQKRDWYEALRISQKHHHPFLAPWRSGFLLLMEGKHEIHDIEEAVSIEGNRLMTQLESALKPLGAIITILPMLGFLGTILGLIASFQHWEQMGAQVSINVLAGGIYQAMITTAAGLIAAIPYYLCYHILIGRTQKTALNFSEETTQLFRWIKEGLMVEIPVDSEEPAKTSL